MPTSGIQVHFTLKLVQLSGESSLHLKGLYASKPRPKPATLVEIEVSVGPLLAQYHLFHIVHLCVVSKRYMLCIFECLPL